MSTLGPEDVLAILHSASGATPDSRLDNVLDGFRRHWLAIAGRRGRDRPEDADDAAQEALVKLVSPERLATLREPARLEAWARALFLNALLDRQRDGVRHGRLRTYLTRGAEDPEDVLRDMPAQEPTPEEAAAGRERLAIVVRCLEELEVARLRFVDGLPEKEIAARRRVTRDSVAGQLKRFRKALRRTLGDAE